jgi:hypothetical protein
MMALALGVPAAMAQPRDDAAAASADAGAAAAEGTPLTLVVKRQDTLIGLGRRLFTSPTAWREVARLNRLRNPDRLTPGQTLVVPERLLRWDALEARVVSVAGSVVAAPREAGAPERALAEGDQVAEGSVVYTATGSSAVLELGDGTRVKLPPDSRIEISTNRRYGVPAASPAPGAATPAATGEAAPVSDQDGWFATAMRLISGSVEVVAEKLRPRSRPIETTTPTAVIGVRGTTYRVGLGGEGRTAFTRSEVLEGRVQADARAGGAGAAVKAGFGVALDAQGTPPVVLALPEAPDLAGVPPRHERPVVRFASPEPASALRLQVAEDTAFERIVADQVVAPGTEVRIGGLPDGTWQLRARRIDASGIEGRDGAGRFVLKARPEPPAVITPRPGSKANVAPVDLSWAENVQARSYRIQVAEQADAAFERPVLSREGIEGAGTRIELPGAGLYRWRMASVGVDRSGQPDIGPWGDAQGFELKALPEPPKGGAGRDGAIQLAWGGREQDRYQVELARDEAFGQVVAQAEVDKPEWQPPRQEQGGAYFFRYRSVEPDGWVSPPSSTLRIDVPRPDRGWLWLFAPLLLLI